MKTQSLCALTCMLLWNMEDRREGTRWHMSGVCSATTTCKQACVCVLCLACNMCLCGVCSATQPGSKHVYVCCVWHATCVCVASAQQPQPGRNCVYVCCVWHATCICVASAQQPQPGSNCVYVCCVWHATCVCVASAQQPQPGSKYVYVCCVWHATREHVYVWRLLSNYNLEDIMYMCGVCSATCVCVLCLACNMCGVCSATTTWKQSRVCVL